MTNEIIPQETPTGAPAARPASGLGLSRRGFMTAAAATGMAMGGVTLGGFVTPARAAGKDPASLKFAAALGWTAFDSGTHMLNGYKDAVAAMGGELTISDAGFDPNKQSQQIDAHIANRPDALFITPADVVAITPAIKRATDAGIPVFVGDSLSIGPAFTNTTMSNQFGMGEYTMEYIAAQLGGKGKVATVRLPANETWDLRSHGMRAALARHPGLELVADWAFAFNSNTTPRQAVDNILTANPDIDAIWCAWDGAAVEGALAVRAAGKDDQIIITGIDGGKQAFEYIKAGTSLKLTMGQSLYEVSWLNVQFAHQFLAGNPVPRIVISPVYPVSQDQLKDIDIPDDFDHPGRAQELGWVRAL